MSWRKLADFFFPHIEPLSQKQVEEDKVNLDADVTKIKKRKFSPHDERALDEAQRVASAEGERVKTAESKAATYLAVLAALVPLIITLQSATWENKSGPAPEAVKLTILALATLYIAGAGYHAFRALQVSGFQRVVEPEITAAWKSKHPIRKLTRGTLLASRRSRDTVNAKVTRIKVTHQHLVRAFVAFILLLLADPAFYAFGYRTAEQPDNPALQMSASTPPTERSKAGLGEAPEEQAVESSEEKPEAR